MVCLKEIMRLEWMNIMGEIIEIRSCIEILANDIKVDTTDQYTHCSTVNKELRGIHIRGSSSFKSEQVEAEHERVWTDRACGETLQLSLIAFQQLLNHLQVAFDKQIESLCVTHDQQLVKSIHWNIHVSTTVTCFQLSIGLCSVLRPHQHSIGYMGDGFFTGQKTQPTASKYWRYI